MRERHIKELVLEDGEQVQIKKLNGKVVVTSALVKEEEGGVGYVYKAQMGEEQDQIRIS